MKYLALVLLLSALPSLSSAYCYVKPLDAGVTHCRDDTDNTLHAVGSSWRNSACMDCTCEECCTSFFIPRKFPDECVSTFDSKACEYIVHRRDDPTILCPIYGAVGK